MHRLETVNTQLTNPLMSQLTAISKAGRYNKNFAENVDKVFDEKELLLLLMQLLQEKNLRVATILPCLITLKNIIDTNQETTNKESFENRLQEIIDGDQPIHLDKIINSISYLKNKKQNQDLFDQKINDDKEFNNYLDWLQDRLLYIKVINSPWYANIFQKIRKFTDDTSVSIYDKLFRYFISTNTGVGFGSFFLSWGPMALLSILSSLGIVVPPIGVILTTVGFGIVGSAVGGVLIKKFLNNYEKEDRCLTQQIDKTRQEVIKLARDEAGLCKARYCLNYKNLCLLEKLSGFQKPVNMVFAAPLEPIALKKETPQLELSWRIAMTFVGTVGSVWGFTSLICGLCGISLISAGAFLSGGLIAAVAAVAIAGLVAYKTHSYERKSESSQKILDEINNDVLNVQHRLEEEHTKINNLMTQKESLKLQLVKQYPCQMEELNKEFENIENNAYPLVTADIETQKAVLPPVKSLTRNRSTLFSRLDLVKTQKSGSCDDFVLDCENPGLAF